MADGVAGGVGQALGTGIGGVASVVAQRVLSGSHSGNNHKYQEPVAAAVKNGAKYGISPLALLGITPTQGSFQNAGSSLAGSLSEMGSDFGHAVGKMFDRPTQAEVLALQGLQLQNDLTRAQIARTQKEVLSSPPAPVVSPPVITSGNPSGSPTAQKWGGRYGQLIGEVAGWTQGLADTLDQTGLTNWWNQLGASSKSVPPMVLANPSKGYRGGYVRR